MSTYTRSILNPATLGVDAAAQRQQQVIETVPLIRFSKHIEKQPVVYFKTLNLKTRPQGEPHCDFTTCYAPVKTVNTS